VLSAATGAEERVSAAHRAKLAYVYVRQSSVNQVRQHQESTELQYRLVDRAVGLGWPRERVLVIDEDLGKSGAASAERYGFQRLIAEIGLGNAYSVAPVHHRSGLYTCDRALMRQVVSCHCMQTFRQVTPRQRHQHLRCCLPHAREGPARGDCARER
jgi:hypothetical protein